MRGECRFRRIRAHVASRSTTTTRPHLASKARKFAVSECDVAPTKKHDHWDRLMHLPLRPMASYRLLTGLLTVVSLSVFVQCADKGSSSPKSQNSTTCKGTQALQSLALRGTSMQAKQLSLTFDDGPGDRTTQLSTYLKNQGIQATFFVNGMSMGQGAAEILQHLVDDGHLVANHTEDHKSLTGTATGTARLSEADTVKELQDTDTKIEPFVPSKRFLFRPPFGDYDDTTFEVLAKSPMNKYVGPVLWDVGDQMNEAEGRAADWECWQDGADNKRLPMKACGDLYLTEIRHQGRGIVLMHDPYFNDADPEKLGTVDMVEYIVPILKQEGFTFTRVDQVPDIAKLLPAVASQDGDTPPPSDGTPTTTPNDPASPPADDDPCK